MNIVFFDSETTSLSPLFGQMVEFSAIVCDENLKETGEELHINCRLSPGIIPEAKALLVTSKTIEDINSSSFTHYEMIMQIMDRARKWSPSLWIGWNSIGFDFPYISASFYRCLTETYFHQMHDNRRGDALGIARAIHALNPKILRVPTNERGKNSFRLSDIAEENGIFHEDAHSSRADTLATIEVCRQLAKGADDLWLECLQTTRKSDAERLMSSAPVFTYAQSGFGGAKVSPMTQICYHPTFGYPMGLDISKDPKDYIDLGPEELLGVLRGKQKLLKAIAPNKHPIILNPNRSLDTPSYRNLDLDEALARAATLKSSNKLKLNIVRALELEISRKRPESSNQDGIVRCKEVEEQQVKLPFEDSPKDTYIRKEFEECGDWKFRAKITDEFEDERYKILGKRLIYENQEENLSKDSRDEVEGEIFRRVTAKGTVPWNTIEKTKSSISDIRNDRESKGEPLLEKELKILESVEHYIGRMSDRKF